jgi:phosphoserine phosphatase
MAKQRLYVVHGMGNDAVGLVGRITAPITQANGNILDLRQDVLHGLFTIYMVIDLTNSDLKDDSFQSMITDISDDTGLKITVDSYSPVARSPEKKNLLMVLIGKDKPGIISASSKMLGKYNANIEFAQTIGREDIFLMELLTDVSHVAIPVENLKRTIRKNMEALNIKAVFQDEHVFNKRKRLLLFNFATSFMNQITMSELMQQAGLTPADLRGAFPAGAPIRTLQAAASRLDGLPLDVIETVLSAVTPTPESMELVQTLKVMGYMVGLVSTGFSFFTDHIRKQMEIGYAYGTGLQVDDDARILIGELATDEPGSHDIDGVLSRLRTMEKLGQEDITIITDEGCDETPGIRLDFKLEILLDCFNQHVMSKENLLGLLGGFGIPDLEPFA